MTIDPGDFVRVTAKMSYIGVDDIQNVFHTENDGGTSVDESDFMVALAAHLDTAYGYLADIMEDNVLFTEIDAYNITQDAPILPIDWPTLVNGDVVGETLPLQAAALVSFATRTKNSVGRKYISGVAESMQEAGGQLTTAALALLQDFGDELLLGFTVSTVGFQWGNYRYLDGRFAQWETATPRLIMATQRRRRRGIGS